MSDPICYDCAIANGGKSDDGVHTMSMGKCGVCKQQKFVSAPEDYWLTWQSTTRRTLKRRLVPVKSRVWD